MKLNKKLQGDKSGTSGPVILEMCAFWGGLWEWSVVADALSLNNRLSGETLCDRMYKAKKISVSGRGKVEGFSNALHSGVMQIGIEWAPRE